MTKGVFLFREDSRYEDRPWEVYQFPRDYLSRANQMVGDWVIFMEPVKAGRRGYHAVGRVQRIVPDPSASAMYLAMIEPGSYLPFDHDVPFQSGGSYPERSVLNDGGRVSGRAQAAVRPIPDADFNRIIALGLTAGDDLLPRTDATLPADAFHDERAPYTFEQHRTQMLTLRTVRDRVFRSKVVQAYDRRCAFTGFQFINGGGRAEVEAAHIKSVGAKGPDVVPNGLALSGTVHWMFDRGLLSLADDRTVLLSNHINDVDGLRKILLPDGRARFPAQRRDWPDVAFLAWHRDHVFKGAALTP
ncbi:restriction endonuclease [Sphingomonas ginkgonis]|uniref:Restriction endonuclease n=1 Tax=Sphingomonas ginkgonis TaxID=2315330 RepID=A0A429V690_9SPHN|nr:HNH endonuclease [Sphingomonas ginkgonis]RST29455.1 restriction endonuclease [Sphingomonas ginkgonis]